MSIITYGNTTHLSLQASERLANEGYDVEVLDIRSLIPLDKESILKSVKKTGKVLIVHEDKIFGGFGGELASIISEEAFEFLDAPVRRVGSEFTPVGFNRILESAILPDVTKIYDASLSLLKYWMNEESCHRL